MGQMKLSEQLRFWAGCDVISTHYPSSLPPLKRMVRQAATLEAENERAHVRCKGLEEELACLYNTAHCEHGIRYKDGDCPECEEDSKAFMGGLIGALGSKEKLIAIIDASKSYTRNLEKKNERLSNALEAIANHSSPTQRMCEADEPGAAELPRFLFAEGAAAVWSFQDLALAALREKGEKDEAK